MIDEEQLLEKIKSVSSDAGDERIGPTITVKKIEEIIAEMVSEHETVLTPIEQTTIDLKEKIIIPFDKIINTEIWTEFWNRGSVLISDKHNQIVYKFVNWFIKARPHLFNRSPLWKISPLEKYMLAYTSKYEILIVEFINNNTFSPSIKILKEDGQFHSPGLNDEEIFIKEVMSISNLLHLVYNQGVK